MVVPSSLRPIKEILGLWLFSGRDRASDHSQRRKIVQTNFGALLGVVTVGLFTVLFFLIGNPALVRTAWFMVVCLPFFGLAPWFNHLGRYLSASWVFCLTKTVTVAGLLVVAEGTLLDAYFYFLMFAFAPIAFFPVKRLGPILVLFLLNLSIFLYCQFIGVGPAREMMALDGQTVTALQVLHVVLAVFALLVFMFLSESAAETNERRFELMSMRDPLTDLLNRRGFLDQLAKAQARIRRSRTFGALVFLDLDRFKALNDEHGHALGDQLLVQVSQRIRQSVRAEDLVARFGGDEFVVLVESLDTDRVSSREKAVAVAEKLRSELEAPYGLWAGGGGPGLLVTHRCTASLGVVLFQGDSAPDDVLKWADQSMYRAKESGRNEVCVH